MENPTTSITSPEKSVSSELKPETQVVYVASGEKKEDTAIPPKKPTARQDFEIFSPAPKEWTDETIETLPLLPDSVQNVKDAIEKAPNIDIGSSEKSRHWYETLTDAMESEVPAGRFTDTVNREGSLFTQGIKHENKQLSAGTPSINYSPGEKVSGERGIQRVRSLLGLGTMLQIPLWHSGFWITIKAPGEASLLELQRRIIEEKTNLGRATRGLVFSNTSVYMVKWIMDLVIDQIYDSTLVEPKPDYRKLIKSLDIPTIVWGLACTVWPSGFKYSRSCITDPTVCQHVVEEKIALGKLHWVDSAALTTWQISHMSNRGGSTMSKEAVHRYLEDFERGRNRTITFGETGLKIDLRVPNIDEYLNAGSRWVSDIVQMIDSSITDKDNNAARNFNIDQLGKATTMRQYSHWVDSIDANGVIIDDRDTIEATLADMSSVNDIRKNYLEDIQKYIDDSTISVIAVPSYTCPACGKDQKLDLPRFPHLLPIDAISCFFTLLVPRLAKIQNR